MPHRTKVGVEGPRADAVLAQTAGGVRFEASGVDVAQERGAHPAANGAQPCERACDVFLAAAGGSKRLLEGRKVRRQRLRRGEPDVLQEPNLREPLLHRGRQRFDARACVGVQGLADVRQGRQPFREPCERLGRGPVRERGQENPARGYADVGRERVGGLDLALATTAAAEDSKGHRLLLRLRGAG